MSKQIITVLRAFEKLRNAISAQPYFISPSGRVPSASGSVNKILTMRRKYVQVVWISKPRVGSGEVASLSDVKVVLDVQVLFWPEASIGFGVSCLVVAASAVWIGNFGAGMVEV